jgi:hypothetical protein
MHSGLLRISLEQMETMGFQYGQLHFHFILLVINIFHLLAHILGPLTILKAISDEVLNSPAV